MKQAVKELFKTLDSDRSGSLSRQEVMAIAGSDSVIRIIIEKSIDKVRDIDSWIESYLRKPFQTRITSKQAHLRATLFGSFILTASRKLLERKRPPRTTCSR